MGERIRERRIELGLSQEQLAKKVGYKSRSSINKIELSRDLPLNKIRMMATALDVDPGYICGWYDSPVYHAAEHNANESEKAKQMFDLIKDQKFAEYYLTDDLKEVVQAYYFMSLSEKNIIRRSLGLSPIKDSGGGDKK